MFKDRDVICFLGDSITAYGVWMAEVYQELRKKYRVKCFNAGVPGGRAFMAEKHLYSSCLVYNPDYVTVSFGINDIEPSWYGTYYPELTAEELKDKVPEIYRECYERILNKIIDFGAQPIVCVSTPYDDVSETPNPENGSRKPLERLVEIQLELAGKYNCPLVDFKTVMEPMLGKRKVVSDDRIHPTEDGFHIMAQTFLKDMGETDKADFDTPFVFEDWNKKRFDAEQKLRGFKFVEYVAFIDKWVAGASAEEKKAEAKKAYEGYADKTVGTALWFKDYPAILDAKETIVEKLVRLTI